MPIQIWEACMNVGSVEGNVPIDGAVGNAVGVKMIKTAMEMQENLISSLLEGLGGNFDRTA